MRVLVVDDSQLNLTISKRYLDVIPDITQILLCNDPTMVTALLDENSIDILILDIIMPIISGLDLLEQLRSDSRYDDMPIIMLTSLDDLESYQKCFELGAFDYINKPINAIELNARLKVAIESRNNSNHLKSLIEVTKQQNEELKEINAKLTEAKFSLVQSEKMAAIGQLAAGIAHEINNPMGFVKSNLDILHKYFNRVIEFLSFVQDRINDKEFIVSAEFNQYTSTVSSKYQALKIDLILNELEGIFSDSEGGINRITEIVQSLRVFARSSKDNDKNMNVLLDMIYQVVLITRNEVKFVSKIEINVPDDIVIYCNRIQLGQVFVNIILNAAQAIKSQSRSELGLIKIIACKDNQNIKLWFMDDGPGIPEENILKIFEPFFTTKEIGQGTGLGLSISYDIIVNKHNGSIDVKSELGKGATFIITLPIITEA
ncbi:MAG: ATP-binding protein [Herbinix sp.]|jgi:signal transduction histidine kinase|nr:ATP-binding protein [Herbinix sp.]